MSEWREIQIPKSEFFSCPSDQAGGFVINLSEETRRQNLIKHCLRLNKFKIDWQTGPVIYSKIMPRDQIEQSLIVAFLGGVKVYEPVMKEEDNAV